MAAHQSTGASASFSHSAAISLGRREISGRPPPSPVAGNGWRSRRSALDRRLIAQPSVLSGLDIYSAAKKFETGVLYDFADIEGFQQISVVGQDLDFVTRTAGVIFPRP